MFVAVKNKIFLRSWNEKIASVLQKGVVTSTCIEGRDKNEQKI